MNDSDTVNVESAAQPVLFAKKSPPKERRLFIGLPIYGSIDPQFFCCLLQIVKECQQGDLQAWIEPHLGDSAIGRARNHLTRKFLESDCTHLLFVDSDIIFSADHVRRIMSHNEPIVGGVYYKKQEGNPQPVLNGPLTPTQPNDDHLWEVRYIGTGFICVAREVFEKMIEKCDDIRYQCDQDRKITEWDFWQMGVYKFPDGTRRWLSEDWYFCQRALDLGYKVYADLGVPLKHSGNAVYPLSYQEKQIFSKTPVIAFENVECPHDCKASLKEVFEGEYDFGIKLPANSRIVDVGANVGCFALWASKMWPESELTCYEPNGEIFPYLRRNCTRIKATVVNAAVGDTRRNHLFNNYDTRLACSQYPVNASLRGSEIRVIDPSELPECDLMKIDTEGAEADIVERLINLPSYLIVEYHNAQNHDRVVESLKGRMHVLGERLQGKNNGIMAFKRD